MSKSTKQAKKQSTIQNKNANDNPDKNMTLTGHLKELRNRIVICVVSLVVFFMIGLNFAPQVVNLLTDIGKTYGYEYVYLAPQELLLQYFSIALLCSVVLSLPLIMYHVWAFIQPGLKKNENTLFLLTLFFGLICFVVGIFFAYKVMLPFMLHFLINVSVGSDIVAQISVQNYVGFLLTIFMIFGIIFELPMVSVLLTQLGLLKIQWMKKGTKFVIVLIFVVAALITPPDIVSQIMVALPMMALYEFSILLCSILMKFRKQD